MLFQGPPRRDLNRIRNGGGVNGLYAPGEDSKTDRGNAHKDRKQGRDDGFCNVRHEDSSFHFQAHV